MTECRSEIFRSATVPLEFGYGELSMMAWYQRNVGVAITLVAVAELRIARNEIELITFKERLF